MLSVRLIVGGWLSGAWESDPQLRSDSISTVDRASSTKKFSHEPRQLLHFLLLLQQFALLILFISFIFVFITSSELYCTFIAQTTLVCVETGCAEILGGGALEITVSRH